jgi:hypothetical protein
MMERFYAGLQSSGKGAILKMGFSPGFFDPQR